MLPLMISALLASNTIEVLLFDASGARIEGAVISIADAQAKTDRSGRAVLQQTRQGPLRVRVGDVQREGPVVTPAALIEVIVTWRATGLDVDVRGGDPSDSAPAPPPAPAQERVVTVIVRDALTGVAIDSARCFLRGGGLVGVTDSNGRATVQVPEGGAAISVVHPRFAPRVLDVVGDALEARLLPAAEELDEMTVRAPFIEGALSAAVEEERSDKQIVEVLGAEQMKRSGDSNAAAALKRVTGLSVVGGRYVYVRGLGERYSSTLLDGATLPSPEPERRVVPLDMFPAGILSSVAVQKTWSPDLPGDFGGGVIQLRTRRVPERAFLDLSAGLSGTLGATFTEAPTVPGGALDMLGFDDGTRALPRGLRDASRDQPLAERNSLSTGGYTKEELEGFGESLQRRYTPRPGLILPVGSLSLAFGDRFFDGALGVIGAASYSQTFARPRIERRTYAVGAGGALEPLEDAEGDGLDRAVGLGGLLGLGLELGEHALQSTTFVQRITDEEVRATNGYDRDAATDVRSARARWVERTLLSQRLSGEHALPSLSLEIAWRYGFSLAVRDEPDLRETRYDRDPATGVFLLSDRPEGNQRLFSRLDETANDGALILRAALPAGLVDDDGTIEVGIGAGHKARAVDTRRYTFRFGPEGGDPRLRAKPAEEIFSPENISPGRFELAESTRKTDNYAGNQTLASAWARADWPLPFEVTLSGGARLEAAHIEVQTFELFNAAATPVSSAISTVDVLPALALTWGFLEGMQLRLASAMTVSRPELRELSPAIYIDVNGGRTRYGNPNLTPGSIAHCDARWEWYLSSTDLVSVAVFGKWFTNPIESIVTAGADQAITYANAAAAQNVGLEIEGRFGLERVHPLARGFFVGANAALVHSRVQLPEDGVHTTGDRPLEGQSPWVANLDVGYESEDLGLRAAALYNVFGSRIREVGVLGAPDVYEQPFHQVDLVLSQRIAWGLSLSARAQNLLDGTTLLTQGGEIVERTRRGPSFSVALGLAL
jgi:hypothetical protein